MHENLDSSGRLCNFLESHDREMMASCEDAKNRAWQETTAAYLDFTDEALDESSQPMG